MTETTITSDDLQACHRMKNEEKVIVKFKDRKQRSKVIFNWKELNSTGEQPLDLQFVPELNSTGEQPLDLQFVPEVNSTGEQPLDLQFVPSLFINDSMCFENQSLFSSSAIKKCR